MEQLREPERRESRERRWIFSKHCHELFEKLNQLLKGRKTYLAVTCVICQTLAAIGKNWPNICQCSKLLRAIFFEITTVISYPLFTAQTPDWRRHARSRPNGRSRANPSQESRRARPGPRSATFRRPPASPPPQSRTSDGWAGLDETIVPC